MSYIKKPQQKYRLRADNYKLLGAGGGGGGGGVKHDLLDPNARPQLSAVVRNIWSA